MRCLGNFTPSADLQRCYNIVYPGVGTNCTLDCSDAVYYCGWHLMLQQWSESLYKTNQYIISEYTLPVFIILKIVFLLALRFLPGLTGVVFKFLRLIVLCQFFQSIFYLLSLDIYPYHFSYKGIVMNVMQNLVPAVKLFTCMSSFFLTLDRYLAVCRVPYYNTLAKKRFFYFSLLISLMVSALYWHFFFEVRLDSSQTNSSSSYSFALTSDSKSYQYRTFIFACTIVAVKIFLLFSMIFMGSAIAYRLKQRGRQVADMLSSAAAKKELREMEALVRAQMIDTVLMCLDIMAAITTDIWLIFINMKKAPTDKCAFNKNLYALNASLAGGLFQIFSNEMHAFAHSELIFIYFILLKAFRRAVLKCVKNLFMKCKQCCCN